jgi:hypothetical protein
MASAIGTPALVSLGGIAHNYLSVKLGKMVGAFNLPMGAKITHLGLAGFLGSALLGYFGRGRFSDALAHVAAGMASEGFNVPAVEAVQRPEGTIGGGSIGAAPYVPDGAY